MRKKAISSIWAGLVVAGFLGVTFVGDQKEWQQFREPGGSGKAIIVTARKFLGIIYNTLKNDWVFKDFPNFVIASTETK